MCSQLIRVALTLVGSPSSDFQHASLELQVQVINLYAYTSMYAICMLKSILEQISLAGGA